MPPLENTVRVDMDASISPWKNASCGGLIRNNKGEWICGFTRAVGDVPIVLAEMMAIKTGLEVAFQLGFNKIILYSDSLNVINMILRDYVVDHFWRTDINDIRDLIYSNREVEIHHAYREVL